MLKVKDVVKITGLSKRTLQYYDEIGLMHPERTALNYRVYSDMDLERLWQIQVYKEMGLQLSEIGRLLRESDEEQRKQILEEKIRLLEQKLEDLERKCRFMEKIKENGIPGRRAVKSAKGALTYQELARILAERIE